MDEVCRYTLFDNVLRYEPYKAAARYPGAAKSGDGGNMAGLMRLLNTWSFIYAHGFVRVEAHTSEQAARMVSMDAAAKNADEMIEELTHMYNRKRQAAITQELSEIIGGTNIINKGEPDDS